MDCEGGHQAQPSSSSSPAENASLSAVNSLILDYYKKFGRKRDLEQYFSLSTAQCDIRDPSSAFWTRMKSELESDSGERSDKKSDSSQELCRISIRCSVPDPCTSQQDDSKTKAESVSPPIIVEEVSHDSRQCSEESRQHSQDSRHHSDDDAMKSDDNHSQKSYSALDTSANKALSPTSSAASQRRLEWDALADVGYDNDTHKTSTSSLSTLERLALRHHYTDTSNLGLPTAQSTPLDDDQPKPKTKKVTKKSTKIYKKDVDFLEVNVPHGSSDPSPAINVNLTKHISFSVEKDGRVTVEDVGKDVSVSPEKVNVEANICKEKSDKEIQTSLTKTKASNDSPITPAQKQIPIMISLNTLRNRTRRKRIRRARRKLIKRMDKENPHEKSGQLSDADSFEYMPAHVYQQSQTSAAGNKSSLESSAAPTTDSSKGSKHSFSKDLAKSVDFLKKALRNRFDDADLKRKLIKCVCQRLIDTHYRDDSTTDFLSGISDGSKKSEDRNRTTSTSDANNSAQNTKRPRRSILRADKFNAGDLASTSQSAPNLTAAAASDKLVSSHLARALTSSNTDTDISSKERTSSDNAIKTSDALYQKYLQAVKREKAHERHLKDKEVFLKQKLASSDGAFKMPAKGEPKTDKLKDLIDDLTRNNYNDGSGDASLLEGTSGRPIDIDKVVPNRNQRSHSVFTLSSSSDKKASGKKKLESEAKDVSKPGPRAPHCCCCARHSPPGGAHATAILTTDNDTRTRDPLPSPRHTRYSDSANDAACQNKSAGGKCVCRCRTHDNNADNVIIYQCPHYKIDDRLRSDRRVSSRDEDRPSTSKNPDNIKVSDAGYGLKRVSTKFSQTNMLLEMLRRKSSDRSVSSTKSGNDGNDGRGEHVIARKDGLIYEATRWIQTEISIDPRISQASLSDVNIVSEGECAGLVGQYCRRASNPSLTDIFVSHADAETCTDSGSIRSGTSKADRAEFEEHNLPLNENIKYQHPSTMQNKDKRESFAIPIQGTNMTLMVNIAADCNAGTSDDIHEADTKGETTDIGKSPEEASAVDECSKVEQTNKVLKIDHNSNCMVNAVTEPKSSTYPKAHLPKNLACNIHKLSKACSVQTDHCNNRDAETQENIPIETQTSSDQFEIIDSKQGHSKDDATNARKNNLEHTSDMENTKGRKYSSGLDSGQNKEKLDNIHVDLKNNLQKISKESQCSIESLRRHDRDNILQDDRTEPVERSEIEPREKEAQFKEKENKEEKASGSYQNDIQHSLLPEQSRKTSMAKKDTAEHINDKFLLAAKDKVEHCPCGCGGAKYKCLKGCTQRCVLQRERSRSLPIEKNSCTHAVLFSELAEKCPCGCDGTKDKCIINCTDKVTDRLCTAAKQRQTNDNKTSTETEVSCKNGDKNDNQTSPPEMIQDSRDRKEVGTQKGLSDVGKKSEVESDTSRSSREKVKHIPETNSRGQRPQLNSRGEQTDNIVSNKDRQSRGDIEPTDSDSDPIMNLIRDITRRYSKRDAEKSKRKKCFTDIVLALNYLLETDERGSGQAEVTQKTVLPKASEADQEETENFTHTAKRANDRAAQLPKRTKPRAPVKEPPPTSTDVPTTSSDSAACKVLNKIKKECEKYQQKRCKPHCGRTLESSSSSARCERCRRAHRCHQHTKTADNSRKAPIAYNLILQTSESVISEEAPPDNPQLQSVVVKVPLMKPTENIPFRELAAKFERKMPSFNTESVKVGRSRSLPDDGDMSSMEEVMRRARGCTLREYLELNRPDFIERAARRIHCAPHCARDARVLPGRGDAAAAKLTSEREMKRHSKQIYKSLPEVTRLTHDARREAAKKTNLLMAQIFKRNLQKKTLRGSVNLSHYTTVIKI